jgi:CO/xanthine dehydrogenase Mo-binding subunit
MTTVTPMEVPESPAAPEETELGRRAVGRSIPRKEDGRLVRGEGVYFDDRHRGDGGFMQIVRSPYAHARIVSIDVSKAIELDGVYGTITGEEVAALTQPYFQLQMPPSNEILDYCMAVGKTRYMGEPVVAVVARTRDLAHDAADLVEVEYEPLPVNVDARRALDGDVPLLHEKAGTNLVWEGSFDWGDPEAAFAEADRIVRIDELHFHRFSSTPIECCGVIAEHDRATGQFTLYCNHQFPGMALVFMAPALGVGMDKIRFVTHDIGGGFGNKVIMHTYLLITMLLARKLGRPVQWTETRTENHMANTHGNERWFHDTEVAVRNDGTILGFRTKAIDDCGAYPRYEPIGCVVWSQVTTGCYGIRNVHVDFTQVCTSKSPCGPNRGYSRLQHLWFIERMIDIVGHELGLDPVEMRKRNYVRADEMPYETVNGCVYDSGDYAQSLDKALGLIGYDDWRRRQADDQERLIGIGIGSTLDSGTNNFAQAQLVNPDLPFSGNSEAATVKLDVGGEVVVTLGTAPQGQGHETTASQVVADVLGIQPDDVYVRPGHDSFYNNHVTFSGTYASQFAVTGLGAVSGAAERLARDIRRIAAFMLDAGADEIVLEGGAAKVRGDEERQVPIGACAFKVNAASADLPDELDEVDLNVRHVYKTKFDPIDVERRFGNLTLTYSSQIHACVVEIDRETGAVEILAYGVVDDCGRRINPQIVEGQVHGATAHAIGAALHEAFEYDAQGLLLQANFYDYHAIHALEMPDLRVGSIESPSPFTPLGSKGLGEGGGGGLHAVAAAIQDAIARAGGGVVHESHNDHERVWRLLHEPAESRTRVRVTPPVSGSG